MFGTKYVLVHVLSFACLAFSNATTALAAVAVWDGSLGNWSDASSWSTDPLIPNNGNGGQMFDVSVNGGAVDIDIAATVEAYTQDGGTVAISGPGESFTVNGPATIASTGTATLNIGNGAQMSVQTFGSIGKTGRGTINISNGGVLNVVSYDWFTLGGASSNLQNGGVGTVNVDGPGSTFTVPGAINRYVTLGAGGSGNLTITNAGKVSLGALAVGGRSISGAFYRTGYGEVVVDGASSRLLLSDWIGIGTDKAIGDVEVSNGGRIEAENVYVADRGRLLLDGGTIAAFKDFFPNEFNIEGLVTGTGTLQSDFAWVNNYGTLAPGNAIRTQTIDGYF